MLTLGKNIKDGSPVSLTLDERRQGTYIIGTTGTGKSTLLKNIIYQDLREDLPEEHKRGLCLLDPHGDLVDELLELVPKKRVEDVIFFNPMDMDRPFGLNLLACNTDDPEEVYWVVSAVMGAFQRLFAYSWGPRLEHVLRNSLLTALQEPNPTFIDLLFLLMTTKEQRGKIAKKTKDPILRRFWETFPEGERLEYELVSSTLNKVSPFLTDLRIRNIIGQPENTINMQDIMDDGKILLVNLSKGDLGEDNSSLLGSVLVNQIWLAALKRRSQPEDQRRPFHLIVDEFQNFATESFAILQSEARKYAVDVVVAHQFRDQLDDLSKGSTLNVGNMIVFRVSGRDSYTLASQFDNTPPPPDTRVEPIYREYNYKGMNTLIETELNTGEGKLYQEVELPRRPYSDVEAEMANRLSILPNFEAWCRLIHDPANPENRPELIERHIVTELRGKKERDPSIAAIIRELSSHKAKPRSEVEKEINQRMETKVTEPEVPAAEVKNKPEPQKAKSKRKPTTRRAGSPIRNKSS